MFQTFKNIYHLFQAVIANIYYGFPSRKLKVIGVTGTDGKTTTTHLIYHILKTAGKKVSMVSTVYAKIGAEEFDTGLHTTTPSSFLVQKLLKKAVENGDEFFVLETTSHALDQNRVFGVKYFVAVLTNVTHEHLDYHKTYKKYVDTKAKLLKQSNIVIINSDDHSFERLDKILKHSVNKVYHYGFKHKTHFRLPYKKPLVEYNRYNYLAAYSVASILGIDEKNILKAMNSFKLPPGRLEVVYGKGPTVIIDFAHTPNAFGSVLPEIKKHYVHNGSKLIHVFGSAGLRDKTKRPLMGKASSRYVDQIILTEEDYRTEKMEEICRQIAAGINSKPFIVIPNRQEAINKAMVMARKNDVVLVTGKAHEKSLCRGKKEYPWDEFKAVNTALQIRNK